MCLSASVWGRNFIYLLLASLNVRGLMPNRLCHRMLNFIMKFVLCEISFFIFGLLISGWVSIDHFKTYSFTVMCIHKIAVINSSTPSDKTSHDIFLKGKLLSWSVDTWPNSEIKKIDVTLSTTTPIMHPKYSRAL